MRLTDYEKAMLNGEHGEIRQQAIQALYDLATFYDVDQFVEIVGCHDDSTVYAGEAQVAFAKMLAEKGAKFAVPTTTNATACDINLWDHQKHDIEVMSATRRIEAAHVKMGAVPSWSCAPYHIGVAPSFGQQFASAESNVIMNLLQRGITKWNCVGSYTGTESHVLCVLLSKYELPQLRQVVRHYDPDAFIVLNENVHVQGNFLKRL